MHLEAADIDDALAAADEVEAVAALLDHVLGVDEAVGVGQRAGRGADIAAGRARRADAQRAVLDLHRHLAVAFQEGGGKAGEAVGHLEADPGLGGGVGVAYGHAGEGGLQAVQHRLVGDLARQAHIARGELAESRAHQGAAPVRRRAGNVGDAGRSRPGQEVGRGLLCVGQHHARAAGQGAQQHLQPAIAADVVEGGPDQGLAGPLFRGHGAGQGVKRVGHHLGPAGGARGEHDPLGASAAVPNRDGLGAVDGVAGHLSRQGVRDLAVVQQGVDPGLGADGRQVGGVEIGRAQHQPRGQAVELDQGQGGGKLAAGAHQHRAPGQLGPRRAGGGGQGADDEALARIAEPAGVAGADTLAKRHDQTARAWSDGVRL